MYTSVETQNESSFVYKHFQTEITSNNNNNQHFSDIELSTSSNRKDKCILIKNCFQHNNNTSNHNNNHHHADLSHSDSDINVNALESLRISYSFSETKDNEDTLLERINNGNNVTGHKHKKQIISLKNTEIKPKQKVNVLSLPENSIEHNYYALKKKNQTTKSIKTKLLKNYPLFLKKTNFPLPLQQPLIRHNNNNNNKRNTGISLQHSTINTGRNHQNKLTNKLNNTTVSAVKPKIGVYIHNTTNKLQTTKYRSIYSHNNKRNDKQIVNHLLKQIQFDTINTHYNNTIEYSNGISFEKGKKNQSKQKKVNTSNSAKIKKEGRVNVKKWGCTVNNTTNKKMQGGRMSMSSGKKIRRLEGQFLTEGNIVGGKGKKQNVVKKSDWDYGDLRLSGVNLMFQKNKGNKGSSFISVNNKSKSKKY